MDIAKEYPTSNVDKIIYKILKAALKTSAKWDFCFFGSFERLVK